MNDEYNKIHGIIKENLNIKPHFIPQVCKLAIKRIKYRSLTPSKIVHNLELDIREFHRKEKGDINDE